MLGWVAVTAILRAGRSAIDELHRRLAERGHPDVRPAHGYAFQAIGASGATATELGRRLGVTKQAAGQMVDELVRLGYVVRRADPRLADLDGRVDLGEAELRVQAGAVGAAEEQPALRAELRRVGDRGLH